MNFYVVAGKSGTGVSTVVNRLKSHHGCIDYYSEQALALAREHNPHQKIVVDIGSTTIKSADLIPRLQAKDGAQLLGVTRNISADQANIRKYQPNALFINNGTLEHLYAQVDQFMTLHSAAPMESIVLTADFQQLKL